MNTLHWTLLFAGLLASLHFLLTGLVIARRAKTRISLLDGGDMALLRRIRAHGNLAETAPMALLMLALLELRGVGSSWLIGLGCLLVLGRVLHALGVLSSNAMWSRQGGMVLTLVVISTQAVLCLWLFIR